MVTRTAAEALDNYKVKMGEELGALYHYVLQELCWISSIWDVHEVLFESPESVSLLNARTGSFAHKVQEVFFEYAVLGIGRLTDPATQNRRENSTIMAFPNLVQPEVRHECQQKIDEVKAVVTVVRDWRNRKISHSDLGVKRGEAISKELMSRVAVTESISKIHQVLKLLASHYCETDLGLTELGDECARELQYELLRAQEFRALGDQARSRKDYSSFRLNHPSWMQRAELSLRYDPERIAKVSAALPPI
jgi:AbiU2